MSETEQEDRDAMALLASGEDLALNAIMERWKSRLIAYLYRFTGNEATALELAEETFVRVYQSRAKFRAGGQFSTWLFGIAANLAKNHLRWQRRHPTVTIDEADTVASEGSPLKAVESRERDVFIRCLIFEQD